MVKHPCGYCGIVSCRIRLLLATTLAAMLSPSPVASKIVTVFSNMWSSQSQLPLVPADWDGHALGWWHYQFGQYLWLELAAVPWSGRHMEPLPRLLAADMASAVASTPVATRIHLGRGTRRAMMKHQCGYCGIVSSRIRLLRATTRYNALTFAISLRL
jgi:hypothetical protein